MAERRMFAKTIVESDPFLAQSIKAQCLYFQIGMKVDDDGILNNALTICKSLGFKKDVLDELMKNRFLLDLGDGITVVKHHLINNRIQKDRYKPTIYQEKLQLLTIKDDKSYTFKSNNDVNMEQEWTHNGQQKDTQHSIGKNSIGKYRLLEEDIKNINGRYREMGVDENTFDKAMSIFTKYTCQTSGFYQRIMNILSSVKTFIIR